MSLLNDIFPSHNQAVTKIVLDGEKLSGMPIFITQETRQESYEKIQETVETRQEIVLNELKNKFTEGATAKELSNSLYEKGLTQSPERNAVHPRLNELVEQGFVKVIGKKTCQFTSRKVAMYKYNK